MSQGGEPCELCGAPRTPGYAACKFCKTLFVTDPSTPAVPCPKCATPNEWGAQKCVQCQSWVVVKCVFCNALSPHNVHACVQCREVFAGAPERMQQRQQAASRQQTMQVVGQVGTVAASFLGAAAGVAVSNHSWGGGGYQRNHDGYPHENRGDGYGRDDGYQRNQGGGLMEQVFDSSSSGGASTDYGSTDEAPSGDTGGGGIMSELLGGSGDSSSSSCGSDSGGGILDALMGDSGSSSDDDS